jgi:hypothetical protein
LLPPPLPLLLPPLVPAEAAATEPTATATSSSSIDMAAAAPLTGAGAAIRTPLRPLLLLLTPFPLPFPLPLVDARSAGESASGPGVQLAGRLERGDEGPSSIPSPRNASGRRVTLEVVRISRAWWREAARSVGSNSSPSLANVCWCYNKVNRKKRREKGMSRCEQRRIGGQGLPR